MFRKRTWQEVERRFTPPNYLGAYEAEGVSASAMDTLIRNQEKANFGFTTIEMQCVETGELKFYEEIGDQTK